MNVMVLPELFAKRVHFTAIHSTYLINKYSHLINWKENPSILEFGFADGGTSKMALQPLLPRDYNEFVAADISEPMIEYSKNNRTVPPRGDIIRINMASENVPPTWEGRFHHIFSFFTMHTIQNTRQAFKNIHKMLKPGGEMFHAFFAITPIDFIFHKLGQHEKWSKYGQERMLSPYYYSANVDDSCKNDLKEAGFKQINFRKDDLTYEFPNDKAWQENYLAVNPIIPYIPNEELEEYKEYYFQLIKKHVFIVNTEDQTRPKIQHSTIVISARK